MRIKHSKYKNTGILFELLVRQITADTLKEGESAAVNLLKKYFFKTELGKEYKLYEAVTKSKTLTESKANLFISTILESSKKLNRSALRKEKYNLISEIKQHYAINEFFATKVKNYKQYASTYTLIESYNTDKIVDTEQIVENKVTLLESLTKEQVTSEDVKQNIINEFTTYPKDLRTLTYQVLLEKFNTKYADFTTDQKRILKEFIESADSTPKLRDFYNEQNKILREILKNEIGNTKDKTTQIKLFEVRKLLSDLNKNDKVNSDHLVDLLQYYELVKEIKTANGK